jgi:uncharacterized membrane protein YoaK (UPF0700 family)
LKAPASTVLQGFSRLADRHRTRGANLQLGGILAFVAGAVNAGGFLAVARYTSHVTGVLSSIADELVLGHTTLALAGVALVASFMIGAMVTALLVNWSRRHGLHAEFALPLLLEAALLVAFGWIGLSGGGLHEFVVPTTALLLCFVMGQQNAVITKVSNAEIRTTHMTGIVTDLGIELGRLVYYNHDAHRDARQFVRADRRRLAVHASILGLFVAGGLAGALAFRAAGFAATLPVAALLATVAAPPVLRDVVRWARRLFP